MNSLGTKVVFALGTILLLLAAGAGLGVWMAAQHYRPLLDNANNESAIVKVARDNLEMLAGEQGRKLGDLSKMANNRKKTADEAIAKAALESRLHSEAANRIQQESIAGDQCTATETVIDQELGL